MKAVQFEQFGVPLVVAELDTPTAPAGGVVVQVKAAGLCRSDWHAWQGHDPDITVFPHVPGHEFAGIVHEVGPGVTNLKVGDRVVFPFVCGCGECSWCERGNAQVCPDQWQPGFSGPGTYAEYVAIPRADFNAVVLPDEVSFEVAASLGCRFATSYRAIKHVAKVLPGETVSVFGCGGIGLAAIMIAAASGATVVAVDVNPEALKLAAQVGATHVFNAAEGDVVTAIKNVFPEGVDVSVDALGSIATAKSAVESIRVQGRHVQIGLLLPAKIGDKATVPMHVVIAKELSVLGSHGMAAAAYPEMLADIAAGVIDPGLFITHRIPLDAVPEALAKMSTGTEPGVTIIQP
ncbi:alcohol dehydrogenase [Aurantimicrobium minutum]|uniref:zinc-dependent alcohol dehydrogenase family protein n=1 Tax=Aurantimicrobium minutum TaxID=708131 RepID=UPI0024751544|nr:zinc-dependent alcohol dehydrogenase family protein [Aurantimicrobium minutum]MDH6410257.1 alcohol dehydrogenase [Aurantimicrobium minutum]